MERKIVLTLFYVGVVTAVTGILITTTVYYGFFSKEMKDNLAHECRILARCYDWLSSPDELIRFTGENFRITLIQTDGTVLYESDAAAGTMENHLNRPEVQAAVETGAGSDTRYSDTIGTEDYYYAVRLDDGNVLRVSVQADSVFSLFESMLLIILLLIIGIVIVSSIVSVKLTDNLIAPFKQIPGMLEKNQTPQEICVYEELQPLIQEIRTARSKQEQMRQDFTANVSHELKTPLTVISGYAELIENGMAKTEECTLFAQKIRNESARMLVLIGDILRLSELDSAERSDFPDYVNLAAVAEECRERLSHTARQRGITITLSGSSLPVRGDKEEITELVYNLLDNAIKYNRENGLIEMEIADRTLTVTDTGIGIPKESIPRIFERFYRVDKSRSKMVKGTGLGLSIVKHIADHHGAEIKVESATNAGTSIMVRFR